MPNSKEGGSSQTSELKQIKQLVSENKKLIEDLEERTKKIHSYVKWQRVFFALKLLIILIPVILGIIYLPPLLEKSVEPYEEFLNNIKNLNNTAQDLGNLNFQGNLDINSILDGISR